ncbi:hypothetical protein BC831DRAFT_451973 [Entophlyctis helioformis]|nr:hypothetical protein BC831DRAFT_451973 [Entophlyctis helioformis]
MSHRSLFDGIEQAPLPVYDPQLVRRVADAAIVGIQACFVLAILIVLTTALVPSLRRRLAPYGKTLQHTPATASRPQPAQAPQTPKQASNHGTPAKHVAGPQTDDADSGMSLTDFLQSIEYIPRAAFTQFYVAGAMANTALGMILLMLTLSGTLLPLVSVWLVWALVETQVLRRWSECKRWVAPQSPGSYMHITHFIAGIAFYVGMPLALVVEGSATALVEYVAEHGRRVRQYELDVAAGRDVEVDAFGRPIFRMVRGENKGDQVTTVVMVAVAVFVVASVVQMLVHSYLASLRKRVVHASASSESASSSTEDKAKYPFPTSPLFAWVACPHYLCEAAIYLSLWAIVGFESQTALLVAVWVLTSLSISANEQFNWYRSTYPKRIPAGWSRIVPFIY